MSDLWIIAGEPSGDLHGAALIEQLLKLRSDLHIEAVAGPRMRQFPIRCIEPMESLAVMGFTDVVTSLPKLARLFFSLRRKILDSRPKAVVTIDYPGFNLRLQRSLKKNGFDGQQIHYICPTVWAWGKKRIPLMTKTLDLGLAILPFEPACFSHTPLKMEYVGHPLIKAVKNHVPNENFRSQYGFLPTNKICAIFPGSRQKERERNLPLMLEAASHLQKQDPLLKIAISQDTIDLKDTYDLMREAHLAFAKSGTVTLELALHKTPTIVQYAIKPLDVFLATKIFNISLTYYALPNLILQEELFPELFGPNLTIEALKKQGETLWFDQDKRAALKKSCQRLESCLGSQDASSVAAQKIISRI